MKFVTTCLMYEISKRRVRKPQDEYAVTILQQQKINNSFSRQGAKSCYYCDKPFYIACICYKENNKEREQTKYANNDVDYIFLMRYEAHSKNIYKRIMNSNGYKPMTLIRI